jgi:hypothetical protein
MSTITTADLPEQHHRIGGLRTSSLSADEQQALADAAAASNAGRGLRRSSGNSQCGLCRAWYPNAGVHCENGRTTVIDGELTAGCHKSFGSPEAHLKHIRNGGCVRDLATVGLTEVDGVWQVA